MLQVRFSLVKKFLEVLYYSIVALGVLKEISAGLRLLLDISNRLLLNLRLVAD
jgi:hypothetical protein